MLLNIFLLALVIIGEHYGHAFESALVRRDLIRRNAERSPDDSAIRAWTNTLKKLRMNVDIVFFGNSITANSDFKQYYPEFNIINLGLPGDIIPGMNDRVQMIKAVSPSKVFVMAGTNDLYHISVDQYVARYESLLDNLCNNLPKAQIYIQSVLPMNHSLDSSAPSHKKIHEANEAIKKVAEERGLIFIDLYNLYECKGELPIEYTDDGVHLRPQAYEKWAKALKVYLE